ncbi:hypothetical protein RDABS01_005775, partial [Bienertia sinuspersici]
YMDPKTS